MGDRPALDAVLLDAGGTLVRLDFEWMAETLAALGAPADPAELRRAELEGRRRYDRSRGLGAAHDEPHAAPNGDIHAYFGGLLDGAGLTPPLRDLALERFFERDARVGLWRRPAEGARAALDRLRELGLRCAVVSNSDGRAEMLLADCGMLPGLEFVVDSHRVGVEKPWNLGKFYGTSYFVDPRGQIIAEASEDNDELLVAEFDKLLNDIKHFLFGSNWISGNDSSTGL